MKNIKNCLQNSTSRVNESLRGSITDPSTAMNVKISLRGKTPDEMCFVSGLDICEEVLDKDTVYVMEICENPSDVFSYYHGNFDRYSRGLLYYDQNTDKWMYRNSETKNADYIDDLIDSEIETGICMIYELK